VARDAVLQQLVGGRDYAADVMRERAGKAFDPEVVGALLAGGGEALAFKKEGSLWAEVLRSEPKSVTLVGAQLDRALAAMGDFADLMSPYFLGHSAGVAQLAAEAATHLGLTAGEVVAVRRAGLIHDLGRVAISTAIWQKPGELSADEWERVRLHAYHTERVAAPSPTLAYLAAIAGAHHERLDGSGYHRGSVGPDAVPAGPGAGRSRCLSDDARATPTSPGNPAAGGWEEVGRLGQGGPPRSRSGRCRAGVGRAGRAEDGSTVRTHRAGS
jgi:HD-GYP domain-containing protein (c-di-GMP phosphodiesterase class II)